MSDKEKLLELIELENRKEAVTFVLELLKTKKVDIVSLYEDYLRSSLNAIECKENDKECIWKEHVRTSIVRTIIEVTYPYVIEATPKELKDKTVLVVCPSEEYHEIGAKMAHNFFTMHGYNSIFIGANTPLDVILDAIDFTNTDYVAISVTNFYNVIKAKKIVEAIKLQTPNIKVLAGGQAFSHKDALDSIQADYHITTFQSIGELA